VEEGEEGKIVPGSHGESNRDYFRDKFIISLKIQYGCWLENVSDYGREGLIKLKVPVSMGIKLLLPKIPEIAFPELYITLL